MPSYISLLVLALAASAVTPVLSAEPPREFEERTSSHVVPVKRKISKGTWFKSLLVAGLVSYAIYDWKPKPKTPVTPPTPPTSGTPSSNGTQSNYGSSAGTTPQPYDPYTSTPQGAQLASNNPPSVAGRNARRRERPRGHRSPVDISKARSFSDSNIRRSSSHLDLLSRADLEEAFGLFSRMLDKLD